MGVPNDIPKAIADLESQIVTLNNSFARWDNVSQSKSGSKEYREMANQLVLQAKKIESLIKQHTF